MNELLRKLPAVHELVQAREAALVKERYELSNEQLTEHVREAVQTVREQIMSGEKLESSSLQEHIFHGLQQLARKKYQPAYRRVINGTGVILHTNLGRARLSDAAVRHVARTAAGYSNLEFDLDTGGRGSRHSLIEELVQEVTGAEAAMVVNNNAAAVFLVLRALAKDREVIVSRGELVEIGGSFRVSSIMEESGAKLVEIGTTNKTHLHDYANATGEETALLMKVHASNFRIEGFTSSVTVSELAKLKAAHPHLIVYEDLGSGALFDFKREGIGDEPLVKDRLAMGADLVSFSGDKLLGGPQAGIVAGSKPLIDRLKQHQLARVLRVDKMTLAALEATLAAYVAQREEDIPVIRDILKTEDTMRRQAEQFQKELPGFFEMECMEVRSAIGGGTLPGVELPSVSVAISCSKYSAESMRKLLRELDTPIIATIRNDKVLIDFRTVAPEDMEALISGFGMIAAGK